MSLKYAIERMLESANKKNSPSKIVSLNVGQCREILAYILQLERQREAVGAHLKVMALPRDEQMLKAFCETERLAARMVVLGRLLRHLTKKKWEPKKPKVVVHKASAVGTSEGG